MQDLTQDIMRRCAAGDASAFARFVETYERPLFAYVYRFTAGERQIPDPEDLVQDVFLKIWKALPDWDPARSSSIQAWVFRIARNHLVSLLRKHRPTMVDVDEDGEDWMSRLEDGNAPSPSRVAEVNQLKDIVASAVSRLPEKHRTALILRYYEDLSYAEIAEVLDCSQGTVKSRIARAREALGVLLKDRLELESEVGRT